MGPRVVGSSPTGHPCREACSSAVRAPDLTSPLLVRSRAEGEGSSRIRGSRVRVPPSFHLRSPRARLRGARGDVPTAQRWACSSAGRALLPFTTLVRLRPGRCERVIPATEEVAGSNPARSHSREQHPWARADAVSVIALPVKGPGPCDPGPIGALRPRLTGAHACCRGAVGHPSPPLAHPRMGRWTRVTRSARVRIPNCIPAVKEQARGVGRIRSVNALEMRGLRPTTNGDIRPRRGPPPMRRTGARYIHLPRKRRRT